MHNAQIATPPLTTNTSAIYCFRKLVAWLLNLCLRSITCVAASTTSNDAVIGAGWCMRRKSPSSRKPCPPPKILFVTNVPPLPFTHTECTIVFGPSFTECGPNPALLLDTCGSIRQPEVSEWLLEFDVKPSTSLLDACDTGFLFLSLLPSASAHPRLTDGVCVHLCMLVF